MKKMKFLTIKSMAVLVYALCTTLALSNQSADKIVTNDVQNEIIQPWTFAQLAILIKEEFPESYEQFTEITFTKRGNYIQPSRATFLIPTRFFKKKLNLEILKERTTNLLIKMGDPGACEEVSIGKSREYTWHEWEDKVVTKVTINFFIGC